MTEKIHVVLASDANYRPGLEAAFGMEAVCFPDGLISPTAFRASQMRASAISVVEEELELH